MGEMHKDFIALMKSGYMPTYLFSRDAFLDFIKKYLEEETIVIVSSDVTDVSLERMESHLGVKDHFKVEFTISADILKSRDVDEFDEKFKYAIIFVKKDELTDEALKAVR